jgi:DNA-binding response OmpR family regulator
VAKQNLLVVDADPRSLRVLEVSLRNAGYNVAGCPSVGKAFEILHANKPDLILSDTAFSDMNGFEFVEQLRQNGDWAEIPFMFLSSDGSIESKIRGLELGVQDYLTKPIYIREVVARVGIELARQTRAGLALKSTDARTRFSGSLSEMSVVDLLQTIDVSRKSGVLTLVAADGQEGMISFDSGAVINATVEDLHGEDAIYRQLLWRDGTFDLEFRRVSLSERTVHRTTQALLMEGMRRLDEWSRLCDFGRCRTNRTT